MQCKVSRKFSRIIVSVAACGNDTPIRKGAQKVDVRGYWRYIFFRSEGSTFMPKRNKYDWDWTSTRVEFLAARIEENLSCGEIARKFNSEYAEECPDLALDKNFILKSVKSRTVQALLVELYGKERRDELVAQVCQPRLTGRPRREGPPPPKKRGPPKTPRTVHRAPAQSPRPGRLVTMADVLAFREKNKTPAQ